MPSLTSPVLFDADLLHKYNQPLPRYTSYPPATELRQQVNQEDVAAAIALGNYQQTPISLYCHIPFCESAWRIGLLLLWLQYGADFDESAQLP